MILRCTGPLTVNWIFKTFWFWTVNRCLFWSEPNISDLISCFSSRLVVNSTILNISSGLRAVFQLVFGPLRLGSGPDGPCSVQSSSSLGVFVQLSAAARVWPPLRVFWVGIHRPVSLLDVGQVSHPAAAVQLRRPVICCWIIIHGPEQVVTLEMFFCFQI